MRCVIYPLRKIDGRRTGPGEVVRSVIAKYEMLFYKPGGTFGAWASWSSSALLDRHFFFSHESAT